LLEEPSIMVEPEALQTGQSSPPALKWFKPDP
jgi:hypothetical protein